jgi:hypothetical protein
MTALRRSGTKRARKRAPLSKAKAPSPAQTLAAIRAELHDLADPVRAVHSLRFFKTGPGQYGEGAIERHPERVRKHYLAGTI